MAATCGHKRATSEPKRGQGTPRRPSEEKYRFLILEGSLFGHDFGRFWVDMGGPGFKKATLEATAEPFGDPDP